MSSTLIKNVTIVNEGCKYPSDVLIKNDRIEKIAHTITPSGPEAVIDGQGGYLLPGMIDDQVHFREPGLTEKGTIATESAAAVAGGITSFMEMPNVNPATTTIDALEKKFAIAREKSLANYSFYLGATENNIEQIKQLDPAKHCGVKVFMGASTGNLLVENPQALEAIFREAPGIIVTHCESGSVIESNLKRLQAEQTDISIIHHPVIRDVEACYASSSYAVSLAEKYQSHLHVLHLTTAKELSLFKPGPIENKRITAEACVHHLWFSEEDYAAKGNLIKCNPSIKAAVDRDALISAVNDDRIDIIATDHAPHTLTEKQAPFMSAPAGLPLVQHALLTLLDHVMAERMTITKVAEKTAHNPAKRYGIIDRGFIREGYFADLVLIDSNDSTPVSHSNALYKCGWTPFDGHIFNTKIAATWVNGQQVYDGQSVKPATAARLHFDKTLFNK